MKKESYTFNILVMPFEDGYMSMCKETGLIRQGRDVSEARNAMFSAMKALIDAVCEDERLEPSLSVGLPFSYKTLFYKTLGKILFTATMDKLSFERNQIQDFRPQIA